MKLGVSAYSYYGALNENFNMSDAIKHAKKTGFDGMEFLTGMTWNELNETDSMKAFHDMCGEEGLEIYSLDGAVNFLGDTDAAIAAAKRMVDNAVALGSPAIRCDTLGGDFGKAGASGIHGAIKIIADAARQVADYGAEKGVKIMVENHGYIMQDSFIVEELINEVAHPNYGALVDIGNFLCADEDPITAVGRMARYVMHVHAKDFHVKSGSEIFLPTNGWFGTRGGNYLRGAILGHGNVPVYQCLRTLAAKGYQGAVSLEFEGIESPIFAIESAFGSLKNAQKFIG